MSVKAYLLCDVKKFHDEEFIVPVQESLIEYEGEPEIKISLLRKNFFLDLTNIVVIMISKLKFTEKHSTKYSIIFLSRLIFLCFITNL